MTSENLPDIDRVAVAVLRIQRDVCEAQRTDMPIVAVALTDAQLVTDTLERLLSWTKSWQQQAAAAHNWRRGAPREPDPEELAQLIEVRGGHELWFMCPRCVAVGRYVLGDYSDFSIDLACEGKCQACENDDRPHQVIHQQAAEAP